MFDSTSQLLSTMIYDLNSRALLKFYVGIARIKLVLRITYLKYVTSLGRPRASLAGKQCFEVLKLKDKIRMEMFHEGVPWKIVNQAILMWGW